MLGLVALFFSISFGAGPRECVPDEYGGIFECNKLKGDVCQNNTDNTGCVYNETTTTGTDDAKACGVLLYNSSSKCNPQCRKVLGDFDHLENGRHLYTICSIFGAFGNSVSDSYESMELGQKMKTTHSEMKSRTKSKSMSRSKSAKIESNYVQPYLGCCVPKLDLPFDDVFKKLVASADPSFDHIKTDAEINALQTEHEKQYYLETIATYKVIATGLIGDDSYDDERCIGWLSANDANVKTCNKCKNSNYLTYTDPYLLYPQKVACVKSCSAINNAPEVNTNNVSKEKACNWAHKGGKNYNDETTRCYWNETNNTCGDWPQASSNYSYCDYEADEIKDNFKYDGITTGYDIDGFVSACKGCKNFFSFVAETDSNEAGDPIPVFFYGCKASCSEYLTNDTYGEYKQQLCEEARNKINAKTQKEYETGSFCSYVGGGTPTCIDIPNKCDDYYGNYTTCKNCNNYITEFREDDYPWEQQVRCYDSCAAIENIETKYVDYKEEACNSAHKGTTGCTYNWEKKCKDDKDMPKPKGYVNDLAPSSTLRVFPSIFLFTALSSLALALLF